MHRVTGTLCDDGVYFDSPDLITLREWLRRWRECSNGDSFGSDIRHDDQESYYEFETALHRIASTSLLTEAWWYVVAVYVRTEVRRSMERRGIRRRLF